MQSSVSSSIFDHCRKKFISLRKELKIGCSRNLDKTESPIHNLPPGPPAPNHPRRTRPLEPSAPNQVSRTTQYFSLPTTFESSQLHRRLRAFSGSLYLNESGDHRCPFSPSCTYVLALLRTWATHHLNNSGTTLCVRSWISTLNGNAQIVRDNYGNQG